LKKRSKKLLIILASAFPERLSQTDKSFLVLFFKKEPLCFYCARTRERHGRFARHRRIVPGEQQWP
jgi:hypothetical protein